MGPWKSKYERWRPQFLKKNLKQVSKCLPAHQRFQAQRFLFPKISSTNKKLFIGPSNFQGLIYHTCETAQAVTLRLLLLCTGI